GRRGRVRVPSRRVLALSRPLDRRRGFRARRPVPPGRRRCRHDRARRARRIARRRGGACCSLSIHPIVADRSQCRDARFRFPHFPTLELDMETRAHWKAFAKGDLAARDALLTENLSLVHHVARQLERKLSNELDHDELVSAGTLGLMSAMNAFDPDRGLAFSTFAVPRIRGAILDELRRQDHVPRSVRRKTRDIGAARGALAARLCRQPDDQEVAAALGVDVETLWKWE